MVTLITSKSIGTLIRRTTLLCSTTRLLGIITSGAEIDPADRVSNRLTTLKGLGKNPSITAKTTSVQEILRWRTLYRQEMNCQIIHDSLHFREGWTQPYILLAGDVPVGYGSVALAGPWKGNPTIFE